MKQLRNGKYFSNNKQVSYLNGLTLTESTCDNTSVDWHYHENAYFSYALQGHCIEKNKKQSYIVKPGTLLFHNWQDVHCNINHAEFSRNFYIEFNDIWSKKNDINFDKLEGSNQIENPFLKSLYHNIFLETKLNDESFEISVESLVHNIFGLLSKESHSRTSKIPHWLFKIREIIHDEFKENLNLTYLSKEVNIHPTHLSREFPRYFKSTIGNYIRKVKVGHSVNLLTTQNSLTDIAYECGFSDQSHFIKCFKSTYKITPNVFRKIISR